MDLNSTIFVRNLLQNILGDGTSSDNGSTDDSVKWIKNNFKNIKIIKNKKNLGVTAAWNQGIQSSFGDFICIANNDLIFSKNCI